MKGWERHAMCTTPYLSQEDLAILSAFARVRGEGARELASLIASSIPLPATQKQARRVALGATVRYRAVGASDTQAVVIACPHDANALLARVSILTPLALGLLGHAEGCTVGIALPHARTLPVDIVEVQPPSSHLCHPR